MSLSAIPLFATAMLVRLILILAIASEVWGASQNYCEPAPGLRSEFEKAAKETGADPADFDRNVAPFRLIRQHYSQDLFAHERYQDAVQQHGIEGHLRALVGEYQRLQIENLDDWRYQYLFYRSLMGRNTPSAIAGLQEIAQSHPEFAPAHRSLAQIFASEAFADDGQERIERDRFQALCPVLEVGLRPGPLPEPSFFIEEAERALAAGGDPKQIVQLTNDAIRADEWRLQRIRPFDWYGLRYKLLQQNNLQAQYWRAWGIEVRSYRSARQMDKADALLNAMEKRATFLNTEADSVRWEALLTLASLYQEGKQQRLAGQKLEAMRKLLAEHPDPDRRAQVEALQSKLNSAGMVN